MGTLDVDELSCGCVFSPVSVHAVVEASDRCQANGMQVHNWRGYPQVQAQWLESARGS